MEIAQINKEMSIDELNNLAFVQDDKVMLISEIAQQNPKQHNRLSSGFDVIDSSIQGGFKTGDFIVISGISGEGKTSWAMTLTYNFIQRNVPCLWFSYEIPIYHLHQKFQQMGLTDNYIAYSPKKNTTGKMEWLIFKIRESWARYKTKVVFIDMIDFLSPLNVQSRDNETIILKKIATELKTLAIELDIIIFTMAHITKLREGEEAGMQNIAWSAGIYQLADYVFMIHREKNKPTQKMGEAIEEDLCTNNSFIKIVKNRDTGILKKIKCQMSQGKFLKLTNNYEQPGNQNGSVNSEGMPNF